MYTFQPGDELTAVRLNQTDPETADSLNNINNNVADLDHNVFELYLQAYFDGKNIPYQALFFDGFSDSLKVGALVNASIVGSSRLVKFTDSGIPLGDGHDGALTLSSTISGNGTKTNISGSVILGATTINVGSSGGFSIGDYVLLHQTLDTANLKDGNVEIAKILSVPNGSSVTLSTGTINAYNSSGAQMVLIKQYSSVTLNSGGIISCDGWNGSTGGIMAIMVQGTLVINSGGFIRANSAGFAPGAGGNNSLGTPGNGENGTGTGGGNGNGSSAGHGGQNTSNNILTSINLGQGGGGGSDEPGFPRPQHGGAGGTGAGAMILITSSIIVNTGGGIEAKGEDGVDKTGVYPNGGAGGGGGGGGGAIRLQANSISIGTGLVTAIGGEVGTNGSGYSTPADGNGENGNIAINNNASIAGTSTPTIDTSFAIPVTGSYKSILTTFQQAKKSLHLWVTRNFSNRFNLAASISSGATTLTIAGDQTGRFANGDTIDIYDSNNFVRERKTLTATPSFGSGVTTLTFTTSIVNAGGFSTSAFIERVDVLPKVSLVDFGTSESFGSLTYVSSVLDPVNSEVEDEYTYTQGTAQEDFKAKLELSRKDISLLVYAKRLGVSLTDI